jgi:hypothetical protein
MHYILLWGSYFRFIQFYYLLPVLRIFSFFSVIMIVTDILSICYLKSCKYGQFFGTRKINDAFGKTLQIGYMGGGFTVIEQAPVL